MQFIGKLLSSLLLKVSLSLLITSSTVFYLVSNPVAIKSSLKEAGVYQDVVPAVFETIESDLDKKQQQTPENSPPDESPFADPAVREILRSSIDPSVLQTQVDGGIESLSQWIESPDGAPLQFALDFQPVKAKIVQNLSVYAVSRTETLPPCSAGGNTADDDQDILSLQCRPPEFSAAVVEQKINEQLSEIEFTITEKTFEKEGSLPLEEQLSDVKRAYGLLRLFVILSAVFTAVSIAIFIFAHRPLREALYDLGKSLLTSGLLIIIPAGLAFFVIPRILSRAAQHQKALGEIAMTFAATYATKILMILLFWGVLISVIAVALMIIDRKYTTKGKKA